MVNTLSGLIFARINFHGRLILDISRGVNFAGNVLDIFRGPTILSYFARIYFHGKWQN